MFAFVALIVLVAAAAFAYLYLNNPDKDVEEPKLEEMTEEDLAIAASILFNQQNSGAETPKFELDVNSDGSIDAYTVEYKIRKPKKAKKKVAKKKPAKKKPKKK